MKTFYLAKHEFSSDIAKDDEFIANGARDKYSIEVWKYLRVQNVLAILMLIALPFLLYDSLTENDKYWFQRWGAIIVAFSAYVDTYSNSPILSRAANHVGTWVFDLTTTIHKRSFTSLVAGSVIWAYGDILVDIFRAIICKI